MGAKLSNSTSFNRSDPNGHNNIPENTQISGFDDLSGGDMMGNADFSILDDLLVDILANLSADDLLRNCRSVCKTWKDLIDGHSIWKMKCKREKKCIPKIKFKNLPLHFYRKIYFYDPFGRNLIENPCGEDGLRSWTLTANSGDGFCVENPPAGAEPVPSEIGVQSCFATAYMPCVKHQIIDLLAEGVPKEVLQLKTTKIHVGEWYAARFDCASEYRLNVILLDQYYNLMDETLTLESHMVDNFEFQFREEQWAGKEWHKVTHTFEDVSKARYVFFQHFGKDCQFWAGHYGIKMTGAFVKIVV